VIELWFSGTIYPIIIRMSLPFFCWLVSILDRFFFNGKFVSSQLLFTNLKLSVIKPYMESEAVTYPFSFSLYTRCL
jgi:hypothetical protein